MNTNFQLDNNFNELKGKNPQKILQSSINFDNININKNQENINNIKNNINYEDKNDVMTYINKIKDNSKNMTEDEKNNCYNKIVSLLKANNQPISMIFTQLDKECSSKIYELYHSYNSQNSFKNENKKNNIITKNSNILKISLTNEPKNKKNQNDTKLTNLVLSDQTKRIQEYKNKLNSLTNKENNNNPVDIFSNNNFNFNNKINDENKQINNYNDTNNLSYLEKRKKEIDDLSKANEIKSKTIFDSQSDIPQVNVSFYTNNNYNYPMNNSYINQSIINDKNASQNSMEFVKNMKMQLDRIRVGINQNNKFIN